MVVLGGGSVDHDTYPFRVDSGNEFRESRSGDQADIATSSTHSPCLRAACAGCDQRLARVTGTRRCTTPRRAAPVVKGAGRSQRSPTGGRARPADGALTGLVPNRLRSASMVLMIAGVIGVAGVSVFVGSVWVSPSVVLRVIGSKIGLVDGRDLDPALAKVVWNLRVPRVLLGAVVMSGNEATGCPAGNVSASPSPAPSSRAPRSWCSTKRPRDRHRRPHGPAPDPSTARVRQDRE
jgi:hypothetical protein